MKRLLVTTSLFLVTLGLYSPAKASLPPAENVGFLMGEAICDGMLNSEELLDPEALDNAYSTLIDVYGNDSLEPLFEKIAISFLSFDTDIIEDPYLLSLFQRFMLTIVEDKTCFKNFIGRWVLAGPGSLLDLDPLGIEGLEELNKPQN